MRKESKGGVCETKHVETSQHQAKHREYDNTAAGWEIVVKKNTIRDTITLQETDQ